MSKKEPAIRLASRLVIREESDNYAILYDPDNGQSFAINPVCVVICRLLDGNHPVGQIATEIRRIFSDAPETVEEDIRSLLDVLVQRGFASDDRPSSKRKNR